MKVRQIITAWSVIAGVGMCLASVVEPVQAHHAFAAEFDAERPVEFSGTVTKVEWINPHVWIHLDVTTDDGAVEP